MSYPNERQQGTFVNRITLSLKKIAPGLQGSNLGSLLFINPHE